MSKYNYNLLKRSGDSVMVKLPKNDKMANGRPIEESRARTAARVYARNNKFKVKCIKQGLSLNVQRVGSNLKEKDLVISGRSLTVHYETRPEQKGDNEPFFPAEHIIYSIDEGKKCVWGQLTSEQVKQIEKQLD